MDKLVSIIMPAYNSEEYIKASIESVIRQTYANWELIIIDDCSTDNTVNFVEDYLDDKRIRLLQNETNSGAALSRNWGLREAKGRYIAFLDSDDIWDTSKLEKQLNFMEKQGYSFTYTDYQIKLNGVWEDCIRTAPDKVTKRTIYNYCYFSTITVMYDRDVVGLIQIENLRKNNDYAMWIQALQKCDAYRLPECLSYYIKHDNSISSGNKLKLIKWHYILWKQGLKKSQVMAALLTVNNLIHGVIKKLKYQQKL